MQSDFIMKIIAFLVFAVIVTVKTSGQQNEPLRKKHFNLEGNLAIEGYDPVAYFLQGKAIKGNKDLTVTQQGVLYYFSSLANKEEFKKNPAKYEPQYGGWCAYAMGAENEKVNVDPKTFKIVDGKLYLFYNRFFNNTLPEWNKDETNLKTKADKNWTTIYH
jgi:YHS domain-containing protein